MKNICNLSFIIFFLTLTAKAQVNFIKEDWSKLSEISAKENKLVMVDMTATWCYWCKVMDKKVFADKATGNFYNENFINVKLYDTESLGKEFGKKFNIQYFPTILFLDNDQNLIHKIEGAITKPKDFIQEGKNVLNTK